MLEASSSVRLGMTADSADSNPMLPVKALPDMSMVCSAERKPGCSAAMVVMACTMSLATSPSRALSASESVSRRGRARASAGKRPVSPCPERSMPTMWPRLTSTPARVATLSMPPDMSHGVGQPPATRASRSRQRVSHSDSSSVARLDGNGRCELAELLLAHAAADTVG